MTTTERDLVCRLTAGGGTGEALVHLVELTYDADISLWNATFELADGDLPSRGVLDVRSGPVGLELADGRRGFIHITHAHRTAGSTRFAGVGRESPFFLPLARTTP